MKTRELVTAPWIDDLANEIAGLDHSKPPISPRRIARDEPILAFGDDFCGTFDGRIEYYRATQQFLLFYDNVQGEDAPRVRFSLGHELGHYFIDHHREDLKRGKGVHGSRVDFVSDHEREREADTFAASLLLPRFLLEDTLNLHPPTLDYVIRLAGQYATSLTSTALRVVALSHFPCALVRLHEGKVEFGSISESLRMRRMRSLPQGTPAPAGSVSHRLSLDSRRIRSAAREEGSIKVGKWFDTDQDLELQEDAVGLGSFGRVLTLLTLDEADFGEDDD